MMQASNHNGMVIKIKPPCIIIRYIHPSSLMKTTHVLIAALAIALPVTVLHAGDPAKKEAKKEAQGLMAQYDKNGNGVIDGDEIDALKKAFEADKTGPLKKFDTN